jgi:hypothetical protein
MKHGNKIGQGKWRTVYEHLDDQTLVIKKLTPDRKKLSKNGIYYLEENFNPNLQEWKVWQKYKDTDYAQYLCPCVSITDDGQFLVMKRAKNAKTMLKNKLPNEIEDTEWLQNWGTFEDRTVIVDYGNVHNI